MRASTWIVMVAAVLVGGATPTAEAATLSATFTTTANGGTYAPRNVVAVWVEGPGGTFVKTIGRWAAVRQGNLVAWVAKAGPNDTDAVSGASRLDHATPLTVTWDLKDKLGALVADGTYTIRMELADSNTNSAANNRQGTFTFIKGATAQDQTALTNGGFTNVSIHFDPAGATTPPTDPPPSGSNTPPPSGGSDDMPPPDDYDAVEGGCAVGGSGAGLAMIAITGMLVVRRRRR